MPRLHSPAGGLDKGPEDPSIGLVDLELRVPLDAKTKALPRILYPLDDAVLGDSVDDETGPGLLDRLVMRAVDRKARRPR